jgi:hypothetical protein
VTASKKDVIEAGQQFEQVPGQHVRPDFGDEAGRLSRPLTPIGDGRDRVELVGVAEDGEEEFVLARQDDLVAGIGRKLAREFGRSGNHARKLVGTSRKFDSWQVRRIDPLGFRDSGDCILELVSDAIRNEIRNPAL